MGSSPVCGTCAFSLEEEKKEQCDSVPQALDIWQGAPAALLAPGDTWGTSHLVAEVLPQHCSRHISSERRTDT